MNCEWHCKFRRLFERMPYPGPKKKHHSILGTLQNWKYVYLSHHFTSMGSMIRSHNCGCSQTEPWHEQFQRQVQVVVVLILHTLQQHRLATHHMAHPENCSCGHSFLKESLIALNLKFQVGMYTCSCSWWRSTKSPTKNVIKRAWCQDTATWYNPSTSHYLTISFGTLWSW